MADTTNQEKIKDNNRNNNNNNNKKFKPVVPPDPNSFFKKFSEIEPIYRTQAIEEIKEKGLDKAEVEWVVLEKVHGANFCFITDGENVQCAKRTSLLSEDDNKLFFNFKTQCLDLYREKVLKAWTTVLSVTQQDNSEKKPESPVLRIYGELFGGIYPHPDVKKVANVMHVQKGIYYVPYLEFYGFDINFNGRYLNYDLAMKVFKEAGFRIYAEPLFRGTFQECMDYPKRFITTLPKKYFDLPEIPNNFAEGTVIKPVNTMYFNKGGRVMIKNKIEEMTEKAARPTPKTEQKIPTAKKHSNPLVGELIEELDSYCTYPRVENVISKMGVVNEWDKSKVIGNYSIDVWDEFLKDQEKKFQELLPVEQKAIKRHLGTVSSKIVINFFVRKQREEEEMKQKEEK